MSKQIVRCQGDIEDPFISRNDLIESLRNMAKEERSLAEKVCLRDLATRLEGLEYVDD